MVLVQAMVLACGAGPPWEELHFAEAAAEEEVSWPCGMTVWRVTAVMKRESRAIQWYLGRAAAPRPSGTLVSADHCLQVLVP